MSFALGMGFPLVSAAPIDALYNGAAYLNPVFSKPLPSEMMSAITSLKVYTQHDPIALMQLPHVYPVDFTNPATVVDAALRAHSERFSSYQPDILTEEAIRARVCSALTRSLEDEVRNPVQPIPDVSILGMNASRSGPLASR